MNIFTDDAMRLRRRPSNVAGHLRFVMRDSPGAKTERRGIGIAGLHLKLRPVDGPPVETRRRPSLKPATAQTELLERFPQQHRSRLSGASRRILLLAAVDQSVEERAGRNNDRGRTHGASVAKADTGDNTSVVSRQSSVVRKIARQDRSFGS